jgi:ATP-binding protein involved in chromosome partitioning
MENQNPFEDQKQSIQKLSKIYKLGIHSGKGGVGKTFLSVNIAYSLAAAGYKVGLLDADIDCPNVSKFLSISAIATKSGSKLYPIDHNGVKIISTALLNPPSEAPIIIRGPIKHNMLVSFLSASEWGDLDFLIIDLPPGTADVPLSAMQLSALDGLILVSAPTKEAILDTSRAANMAKKLGVKILGLVENMSGEIFGSHGEEMAKKLEVELLTSIPLSKETAQLNEKAEIAFLNNELLFPLRDRLMDKIKQAASR